MTTLPYHIWDVFTDRPYAGNPLAIVEDAQGLSDSQMLAMAREFNLSETIFLMPPADPAHDARARIWFPTAEIPFAGHPTLGAALFLARRTGKARIVLEEQAGLVPVEIERGERLAGMFDAPVLPAPHPGEAPAALVAAALDLPEAAIGHGGQAPGLWQGGPAFLFVPVADGAALARARPVEPHWSALMEAGGVDAAYLHAPGPEGGLRARMFSPGAGIPEDPATGSATALLAGQLHAAGALAQGETRLIIAQGVEMGRPSRLELVAEVAGGALRRVRVGGAAVPVASGHIAPPPAGQIALGAPVG